MIGNVKVTGPACGDFAVAESLPVEIHTRCPQPVWLACWCCGKGRPVEQLRWVLTNDIDAEGYAAVPVCDAARLADCLLRIDRQESASGSALGDPFQPNWASPPGDTLHALLTELPLDAEDCAAGLGLSMRELDQLLEGERQIDPELAAKLTALFGASPEFWLAREAQYREDLARREAQLAVGAGA